MRIITMKVSRKTRAGSRKQVKLLTVASIFAWLALITLALMARSSLQQPTGSTQQSTRQQHSESKGIYKRSFAGLGCLGVYDKGKFARLDRVCEECYQLYREPDIHAACR